MVLDFRLSILSKGLTDSKSHICEFVPDHVGRILTILDDTEYTLVDHTLRHSKEFL